MSATLLGRWIPTGDGCVQHDAMSPSEEKDGYDA